MTAIIFGNMTVLFANLSRRSTKFQEDYDNANLTMENIRITQELKDKINAYLEATYANLHRKAELEEFSKLLSPSLKLEVKEQLYIKYLCDSPLFAENTEVLTSLVRKIDNTIYVPEDDIIRQYESGS